MASAPPIVPVRGPFLLSPPRRPQRHDPQQLALDLDENTTYAELIESGTPDQITAWRAALDARAVLDSIATTRIAMSAWLNLPPQDSAHYRTEVADYTPAFLSLAAPMRPDPSDLSPNAITHRWLNMQNADGTALRLNTIAELNNIGYAIN